jgi:rhodanese-related sulfurtransferase
MKNLLASLFGITTSKGNSKMIENGFPSNAKEILNQNQVVVVDVREDAEVAQGMAAGAIHMPLSAIEAGTQKYKDFLAKLPKDKEIWFYCRSGGRSGRVCTIVANHGFKVRNIGGFSSWQAQGLPSK